MALKENPICLKSVSGLRELLHMSFKRCIKPFVVLDGAFCKFCKIHRTTSLEFGIGWVADNKFENEKCGVRKTRVQHPAPTSLTHSNLCLALWLHCGNCRHQVFMKNMWDKENRISGFAVAMLNRAPLKIGAVNHGSCSCCILCY